MVNVVNKMCQSYGCMKVNPFPKMKIFFCVDMHILAYVKRKSTAVCFSSQQLEIETFWIVFVCIIVFVESSCSAQHSTFRLSVQVYFAPR